MTVDASEREEWKALVEADTLHMLPVEAHIASVRHLAQRLLDLTEPSRMTLSEVDVHTALGNAGFGGQSIENILNGLHKEGWALVYGVDPGVYEADTSSDGHYLRRIS